MAGVFPMSGRTKVEGWLTVSGTAVTLFEDEHRLPLLPPDVAAHLATHAEHLCPLLLVLVLVLVLGLATRLSAAALLAMTLEIQIFVYPSAWATHLGWATLPLYLVARGPGGLSLDAWWFGWPPGSTARGGRAVPRQRSTASPFCTPGRWCIRSRQALTAG